MSESVSLPRIGDKAQDFKAVTTVSQDFGFSQWQEQDWVVLFSHPADFTPVCTTELGTLAKMSDKFAKKNCKIIGLSVDSVNDHAEWTKDIEAVSYTHLPLPTKA